MLLVELTGIIVDTLRNSLPNPHSSGNWIYSDYPRCFTEDVQVLTRNGWKRISQTSLGEEILTFDPKEFVLKFEPILDKIITKYTGPTIKIESPQLSLSFTPNHMLPTKFGSNRKVIWREAHRLKQSMYVPRTGKWTGNQLTEIEFPPFTFKKQRDHSQEKIEPSFKIPIEKFLPLLGLYLSEGYLDKHYYVVISQSKEKNRQLILDYLEGSGLKYCVGKDGFTITDRRVGLFFSKFAHDCYSKFIPQEFKDLTPDKLEILLYWLMLGDGSPVDKSKNGFEYYTVSSQLANDVFEILIKVGKIPRMHVKHPILSTVPCYAVKFYSRYKNLKLRKHLFSDFYEGLVYCLTTPSHTLVVRNSKGQLFFSGNSDATFPRISVTQVSGGISAVGIGESLGGSLTGQLYTVDYDIDVWVKVDDRTIIDSVTYVGTKLRDKYADLILTAFENQKPMLKEQHGILDIEILNVTSVPLEETNLLHRKTITIRVAFVWVI